MHLSRRMAAVRGHSKKMALLNTASVKHTPRSKRTGHARRTSDCVLPCRSWSMLTLMIVLLLVVQLGIAAGQTGDLEKYCGTTSNDASPGTVGLRYTYAIYTHIRYYT